MRRERALLAIAWTTLAGCQVWEAGLRDPYDGGAIEPGRPPTDGPILPADAPPPGDRLPDRRLYPPPAPGDPVELGCADGTREGFARVRDWPNIAGCSGAWSLPGVLSPQVRSPACDRGGGNDGPRPGGDGCAVSDLCARGWHVCRDAREVGARSPAGCESAVDSDEPRFFLVLAGASAQGICSPDPMAQNDLHGCGTLGQPETPACVPLTRRLTFIECQSSGVWSCGAVADHLLEAALVTKNDPAQGGALCCRD